MTASGVVSTPSRRTVNDFCHSWPNPWSGPETRLPGHGVVLRAGDAGGRQPVDRWAQFAASRLVGAVLGSVGSIMARSPRLRPRRCQAVAATTAAAFVVDDLDRLVEAGQREDLAVVIGQAGRDQPPAAALRADEEGHEQPDATTVHVLELAEVEDDRRRAVRRRARP